MPYMRTDIKCEMSVSEIMQIYSSNDIFLLHCSQIYCSRTVGESTERCYLEKLF